MEKLFPPCWPGSNWKLISNHCHTRATGHRTAFCQGWQRGGDRAKQWAEESRERGGEQQAMGLGTSLAAQLGSRKKRGMRERADLSVLGYYKLVNQ